MDPESLADRLEERKQKQGLRVLTPVVAGIDFFSNDYLGIVRDGLLENRLAGQVHAFGSTGSRLIGGNAAMTLATEAAIAAFHQSPAALLFTSGYDANTGLAATVARKGDTILFDALSHASVRDGVRLSPAAHFSFRHNDLEDLERLLKKTSGQCFVMTESVFSMDGDRAPLAAIADCCVRYGAFLIVDEAHATGITGPRGAGAVAGLGLEASCFARVHTFGKALGCQGAVVVGSETLRSYLINFCRPFIFSTALPPVAVAAIAASYRLFPGMEGARQTLTAGIARFRQAMQLPLPNGLQYLPSDTAIQAVIVPGSDRVRALAAQLRSTGFAVYPILPPTVAAGSERIRVTLHAYNTLEEIQALAAGIRAFVN